MSDAPRQPGKNPPRSGFGRLLRTLAPKHRGRFWLGIAAIQIGNLGQLAFPLAAGALVDGTLGWTDRRGNVWTPWLARWIDVADINAVGLALAVMAGVVIVCRFVEMALFFEMGERSLAELRLETFSRLIRLPMGFFHRQRVGDLGSRLIDDLGLVRDFWVNDARIILTNGVVAAGSLALMAATSLKLALILGAVTPIAAGLAYWLGRRIRHVAHESQQRLGSSSAILEETLHGIQHVKTSGAEAWAESRYRSALLAALEPLVRVGRQRAALICLIVALVLVAWVFLMWYGSSLIVDQPGHPRELLPGAFTSFMFYVAFCASSAGQLAEVISRVFKSIGAATRLFEVLDEPVESFNGRPSPADRLRGAVRFDAVDFDYAGRPEAPVLRGITLDVKPGERIAIVGSSGAGKSTLVALIARLYDPTGGTLWIDGKPAADYPLGWLRGQIAFVPQEVLLFGGSVAENIGYGMPGATPEQIEAAARRVRALDFIRALPHGFDAAVGDRGSRLSGGQRQRIALARALLRDPGILILDEATSALDRENEQLVQEALEEASRGRTTFIVAHHLATVQRADRIVVLEAGRIVEMGPPATLYAAGGAYRRLCEAAFFDTPPPPAVEP